MSTAPVQLEAGGLLPAKSKVDADAAEQIVARAYRHPALGDRPVIRLASDRLGQAEDLAMEFLGFGAPAVSPPIAVQQRRSLSFAAWALINDPKNARYALDLVKSMKKAGRQAKSKPGHAWDAYTEMAKDLGRSARHFLPPFWEEVGRTFKDLGNQTYAGRALNKSLEAERVHALESDRARRRDVVLEFVLSGCLSGNALSDYGNDLQNHYKPAEAFAIFRDLCVRRTRGGMSAWATMPKDFAKLAKGAGLDGDAELEKWLEEVIEAPAMARAPYQFWKTCSAHCKRIVGRSPAFAVALLRHTRPEPRHYGESKLWPWLDLLEEWGVLDYLWEDEHRGAPPLGEPIAHWFGRVIRDDIPAPKRTFEMLEKLTPRLRKENTPIPLSEKARYHATAIDIDVLEACYGLGIRVADPPPEFTVTFSGWLAANVDHRLRNQDFVESAKDERFTAAIYRALAEALTCRGGELQRGYRQANLEQRAFPLAAGDRPGIKELWRAYTDAVIARLEETGLASFEMARNQLQSTFWQEIVSFFPDLGERLKRIDPVAMLRRTLQAGVFDEYGLPALEAAVEQTKIAITVGHYGSTNTLALTFPNVVLYDKVHAHVVAGDGTTRTHELRLPKKCELTSLLVIGDDLAIAYRDDKYQGHFHWTSDPAQTFDSASYGYYSNTVPTATVLKEGGVFLGQQVVRSGDKQLPASQPYLHDGERFWRMTAEYDQTIHTYRWKIQEVDPQTGKPTRSSVPPWFEETEGGTVEWSAAELLPAPAGSEASPLGTKDGMIGWKVIERNDGSFVGLGIDGRRWDKPLSYLDGSAARPVALIRQAGTSNYLPVTTNGGRSGVYWLWDPTGSTVVATIQDYASDYAYGQETVLPLAYWHFLKVRDEAASKVLRSINHDQCAELSRAASEDRTLHAGMSRSGADAPPNPLKHLLPAVKKLLPTAPVRMALGIARIVEHAERAGAAFIDLRDKSSSDSARGSSSSSRVAHRKIDLAAAHWGLQSFHTYGDRGEISVAAQLSAVAEFFKGNTAPGELPSTQYLWYPMLADLPLRAWQTFWRATAAKMNQKEGTDVPWLEFLKHWHELGIAELPGQFDLMEGVPQGAKKNSWGGYDITTEAGAAFTLKNGDDLFVAIQIESYHRDQQPFQFLRYSTAKKPGNPPGFQVQHVRKIQAKYDRNQMAAFIAAVESSTALPLPSPDELAELANAISTSPAEAGLVWMGGLLLDSYQHNFLPAELRNALGWKTTDASAARQALRNLNNEVRERLYEAVIAPGCAVPFAADRSPALRSLQQAWQSKMPKRLQLDAALQKQLSGLARASRWQVLSHEELLAVAADPAAHPQLQPREIEIKAEKDRSYLHLASNDASDPTALSGTLRSIVQLVALVHAETPAGHPARASMPALIRQTTKLLDYASTLLDLRYVHLYDTGRKKLLKPAEWLTQHLGKTKANSKDGTVRFDDGLIVAAALETGYQALIAFRPAKLKDKSDLARLEGILGIDITEQYTSSQGTLPLVVAIKGPGFQKLAKAIVLKEVPAGQWPQNPNLTAPDVVKAIRKKRKLGEDAAVLYAQILALPDPTSANINNWNGWTAAQYKNAAAELVDGKLVLEATRARAGRSIFLPGEWTDLKSPWLPVETWKFAHLVEFDMKVNELFPAGGPLVLRPFEDLFAAAWQRVLDGDEPRYEEVKRKKKSK